MKKGWIWLIGLLALVALLVGAGFLYNNLKDAYQPEALDTTTPKETEEKAMLAPDITVYDANGNAVKLSDMRGKPVVLNIWASWCDPCKMEMPYFQSASETYADELQFMMVNLSGQDSRQNAEDILEAAGYTFPVYYDQDRAAEQNYYPGSIPATFFIDAEGYLVTYAVGSLNEAVLQQGLDMLLQ